MDLQIRVVEEAEDGYYSVMVRNLTTEVDHTLHTRFSWERAKLEAQFDSEQLFGNCPIVFDVRS
jgi:hypothetical protein